MDATYRYPPSAYCPLTLASLPRPPPPSLPAGVAGGGVGSWVRPHGRREPGRGGAGKQRNDIQRVCFINFPQLSLTFSSITSCVLKSKTVVHFWLCRAAASGSGPRRQQRCCAASVCGRTSWTLRVSSRDPCVWRRPAPEDNVPC